MHLRQVWAPSIMCQAFVMAVLVVISACTVKGAKYPDLNSFCNARASAECSSEVVLACAAPSAAACVTKRQALCVSAAPGGTSYNPSAAEACVTQVSNAYADAKVTLEESKAIDAACVQVFDGPGGMGASCLVDATCKTSAGLRCVLSPGSSQGTCQVPQVVGGGGLCSASNAQCAAGFHCGPSAHCDIDAALNEPCDGQNPCGLGLKCSSAAICEAKSAVGVACASGDECLDGICSKAMTSATGLCVMQVNLAPNEPFCMDSR